MIPTLRAWKLVWLGAALAATLTAGPVLTLSPANNLVGVPGSTVGWGFALTNDVNWIEVVQAQFCLDNPIGNPCFNASMQFFDIISNPPNDLIVGPGGSVTQSYMPAQNKGLGSFTINGGAANGSTVAGNILLTYNTFDSDPNSGGNQIGFNSAISAPARVTAIVPEPSGLVLVGIALTALLPLRAKSKMKLSLPRWSPSNPRNNGSTLT